MNIGPLIGRAEELARIREVLAGRGDGTGVLVVGARGIGKTRLVQEAVRGVDRRTVISLVGTPASAAIPLAPLLTILPEIPAAPGPGIAAASARLSGRRPRPVLIVDDAHWLDPTTQTLLHQLVTAREVRLLSTVRDEQPIPDTLLGLWTGGLLERIDLGPLDPADSARLVAAIAGAPVEASVVADLHSRSGGVPLVLRELMSEALTVGALVVRDGLGCAVRPLPASSRLLDVVAGNLGRLPPGPREVLGVVAVAEPIALPLLSRTVSEEDLQAAEQFGVVLVSRSRLGGSDRHVVTVGHPLYAEVVQAADGTAVRRRILARLIDAAAGLAKGGDVLTLRVASWCLEIGRPVPVDDLFNAVRLSHRALDADHAEQFARELWRERPDYETGVLYAATLGRQRKYQLASEIYLAVKGFQLTEAQRMTRASLANEALVRLGRHHDAIAELAEAEAAISDRGARAHLAARRAMTTMLGGSPRRGLKIILPLVESGHPDEFREGVVFAPGMLAQDGRAEEGLELIERAVRIGETVGAQVTGLVPLDAEWAAYERGLVLMYAGRLVEASECARAGMRGAEEHGSEYLLGAWLNLLGRVELDRGHPAAAILVLGRAVAETATTSGGAQRVLALNALVEAHSLLGQVRAAQEALAAFKENPGNIKWYPPGLAKMAQGHLAMRSTAPQSGLELLRDAYRMALPNSALMALTAAHTISRYGRHAEGMRLAAAVPPIQGPLAPLRLAHIAALAGRDVPALLEAAEGLERLGADLLAAEACGAATAEAARRGDTRTSTHAMRTGRRILRRLEGAQMPDLLALSHAVPARLTGREREIAAMVVAGMTSQEIARSLVISVRTVDNHLQRIYGKLGISGRRELAHTLRSEPPI